jgi:hypothetical protein
VDDGIERFIAEDPIQCLSVQEIGFVKLDGFAADFLDLSKSRLLAVAEVVDYHDLVAPLEQLDACVAAYESGTPGHQNIHTGSPFK